jgi:hypothetical protein
MKNIEYINIIFADATDAEVRRVGGIVDSYEAHKMIPGASDRFMPIIVIRLRGGESVTVSLVSNLHYDIALTRLFNNEVLRLLKAPGKNAGYSVRPASDTEFNILKG